MSYESPVLTLSYPAGSDLSASQYKPVSLTTAGKLQVMTGLTDKFLGVLQDKSTAAGISSKVMLIGVSKVVVGSSSGLEMAIVPGALLTSTGGGVLPSSSGAGNRIVGYALEGCSTFSASTAVSQPVIAMLISHGFAVST